MPVTQEGFDFAYRSNHLQAPMVPTAPNATDTPMGTAMRSMPNQVAVIQAIRPKAGIPIQNPT